MKYFLAIILVIILFFSLSLFPEPKNQDGYKTTTVSIGNTQVRAEISDTDALRTLGLSGRTSLEEGTGMLFVFDSPGSHGIWMKGMNFSIDIVWADEEKIIYIEKNVSPTTFPKFFYPPLPAFFVLELPAGYSDLHDLKVGDFFRTGL